MRLWLVRHGETDWNRERRYQGQTDIPLNDRGREQARVLGRRLAGREWAAIWSSDLRRARETADLVAGDPALVADEPALRELHFGQFEGLTAPEIQARFPEEGAAWWADTLRTRPPGGETLGELDARLRTWWLATRDRVDRDADVMAVGHGGSLNRLVGVLLDLPLESYWRFRLHNTGVAVLAWDGRRAVLEVLNDDCHVMVA